MLLESFASICLVFIDISFLSVCYTKGERKIRFCKFKLHSVNVGRNREDKNQFRADKWRKNEIN